METPRSYVFVHGAWFGGWCWEEVGRLLESYGHEVVAPDLPGRRARWGWAISLGSQRRLLEKVLRSVGKPVVLVCHSLGGIVASELGERYPELIDHIVYVSAYLPRRKDSVATLSRMSEQRNHPYSVSVLRGMIAPKMSEFSHYFLHDCAPELAAATACRLVSEPAVPFVTRVRLSASNFGRIPKMYVVCENDRVLCSSFQKKMADHWSSALSVLSVRACFAADGSG
jgi:pimeloyl-ACP methyl ester carboxylesterase